MACTRRDACKAILLACAGRRLVACGGSDIEDPSGPATFPAADGNVVRLPLADFRALTTAEGWVRGIPPNLSIGAIVIHVGDGSTTADYIALHSACTHMSCGVNYDPSEQRLECPCHGSQFSLSGDVLHGPATDPLATLAVTVVDQAVEVTLI